MYEGTLVRLRAFEPEDLEDNFRFMNDYETVRGMISGLPLPSSHEDERQWLSQQSSFTRGEYQFAIENFEGDLVGRCGVTRCDWKNRLGELGIMIGPGHRACGYGKEAMHLLVDFCFREMGLHRLKVQVYAFNEAAIRCYEANGFEREGLLRGELFRAGAWQDVVVMGLLNPAERCEG